MIKRHDLMNKLTSQDHDLDSLNWDEILEVFAEDRGVLKQIISSKKVSHQHLSKAYSLFLPKTLEATYNHSQFKLEKSFDDFSMEDLEVDFTPENRVEVEILKDLGVTQFYLTLIHSSNNLFSAAIAENDSRLDQLKLSDVIAKREGKYSMTSASISKTLFNMGK